MYGLPIEKDIIEEMELTPTVSCIENVICKKLEKKDDGLIKEIKNDEVSLSGKLELSLDEEDNDIDFKVVESKKVNTQSLILNEYKNLTKKKNETTENELIRNRFKKQLHCGSGDQEIVESIDRFEDIEEKELTPASQNLKHEKVLKQTPNIEKTVQLLDEKINLSRQKPAFDQIELTKSVNVINAMDSSSMLSKNHHNETKAIQIICRTDDILTVLLDRKKETRKNDNNANNSKLRRKFSMFSKFFAGHEVK